jgi:hypothetical protein
MLSLHSFFLDILNVKILLFYRLDPNADDVYSAWFFDLAGTGTDIEIQVNYLPSRGQ